MNAVMHMSMQLKRISGRLDANMNMQVSGEGKMTFSRVGYALRGFPRRSISVLLLSEA